MNTKFCYVVLKEGVYRHEIVGVFTKQVLAEKCACDRIKIEHDDYHTFPVYKCAMNQPIKDGTLVFEVRRNGTELVERRVTT